MTTKVTADSGAAAASTSEAPSIEKVQSSYIPSLSMKMWLLFFLHLCVMILFGTQMATAKKRSPSDFLKSVLGRPVRVKLNSGTEYRGTRYDYICSCVCGT
jgi:hypothetical protein